MLDSPRLVPRQDKTEPDRVRPAMVGRMRLHALVLGCRDLDHEAEQEQEIILTLTDGKLGQENYITQAGANGP